MIVVIGLLVICISVLVNWYFKNINYIHKCLKEFPGPPKLFFFGNALEFLNDEGMLKMFLNYIKKYGDIIHIQIGPFVPLCVYSNAELAKRLLLSSTNLSKGNAYDCISSWLGKGLLTTTEDKWKAQRKMLAPGFSTQLITDFIAVFDEQSNILVEKFKALAPADSCDIHSLMSMCSLDIICDTSMGVSLNAQLDQNTDYVSSVKEMCKITVIRSLHVWKSIDALYIFSKEYKTEKKCLKILHGFTDKVITERRKQRQKQKSSIESVQEDETGKNKKSKYNLLDLLLNYSENERKLTEDEIRQEVHTFMFAGHDTVTSAMDFFIYEVAKHPEIQERILEEQKTVFGSEIYRPVTSQDLHEMRYLESVVKETMRMYPPVPFYSRILAEDINFDGKVIPKGTNLLTFAYALHHNEKYFPDPETFNPTRFENMDSIVSGSYLPFSTGPRNCIGQKFAMYEMKVILSKLIRNFEFSPAEPEHELDVRAEVVLCSRSGIYVKIRPRRM